MRVAESRSSSVSGLLQLLHSTYLRAGDAPSRDHTKRTPTPHSHSEHNTLPCTAHLLRSAQTSAC